MANTGENAVIAAIRAVRPAVVQIVTARPAYDAFLHPVPRAGSGSGVIFDSTGYLLTNNHVVAQADRFTVILPDGRSYIGRIVGTDPTTDLAVVKVDDGSLPTAHLGDSDALEIGEQVVAIGNALGLAGGPTVTSGVVSAKGRTIREQGGFALYDLIQTDAPINPGNSGGPLINVAGQVVGINTAIVAFAQGIGFAISINSAKPIIYDLINHGRVLRPWLGVALTSASPALAAQYGLSRDRGVIILDVQRGSPADTAGLVAGDIIVELAGSPVNDDVDLRRELAKQHIGATVSVRVVRDRREGTVNITLREMPTR
ncbi:MAG: trypsin-like peptidase domain-containing protein [Chloroflexi bacterium]|nr:trypsin-like peptidase domain-containing protein [Chloroflexota bacterium]